MKRALLSLTQVICAGVCFILGIFTAYMVIETIKMWSDKGIIFNISDAIPIFICTMIIAICGGLINITDNAMNATHKPKTFKPKPQNDLFSRDE